MRTKKFYPIFVLFCFAVLWFFAVWKIRLGMHSDEVHSIAIGDVIARGDAFFKETWFYLQMSAVFTAPVIKLFTGITGSTDGILLFFRILSVFIQTMICLYFYHTFKEKFNKKCVAIATILLFTFVPDFQSFTYKQEIIWFAILQIIFSYKYYWGRNKRYLVLLGIMISGSVLAYPTSIVQFPVYLGIIYWIDVVCGEKRSCLKNCAIMSVTCIICALLFFTVVLHKISVTEFLEFFPKVFADNNLDTSFVHKLGHPLKKNIILGVMTVVPIWICHRIKWRRRNGSFLMMALLLWMAFLGQCYIQRKGITWHCITYPYALSVFMVPMLCRFQEKHKGKQHILILFEIPAVTVIFCIALASNQGNITSMYGGIISMLALILMLGEENQNRERKKMPKEHKLIAGSVLLFALIMYVLPVYEQESVDIENIEWRTIVSPRFYVDYGPARGLFLGEKSYDRYSDLCDVVYKYVEKNDAVFIVDDAYTTSYGYLFADGEYATFSPQGGWGLSTSDSAVRYFKDNPQKWPTVVLINRNYIACEIDEYLESTPIGRFLVTNNYGMIADRNGYTVMRK